MTKFLQRCRGAGGKRPPHLGVRAILVGALGGFLAIGALALLSARLDVMLLLGSFGASCVLVFGYPEAPFAQPSGGACALNTVSKLRRRAPAGQLA
jgi:CBS-domain-containing membrane protein